jgi:hypothetical protein
VSCDSVRLGEESGIEALTPDVTPARFLKSLNLLSTINTRMSAAVLRISSFIVFRYVLSLLTFKQDAVWRHFVFSHCETESKTGMTAHVDGV